MTEKTKRVILASASERRSSLLAMCGIRHRVVASGVREVNTTRGNPSEISLQNAIRKARAVAARYDEGLVIGADTIVYLDRRVVGKLRSRREAGKMLMRLAVKGAYVYTGLTVIDAATGRSAAGVVRTKIKVRPIAPAALDRWIEKIGPYDKAGGFSIEGAGSFLFPRIDGCYFNVLGLPLAKLYDLAGRLGYDLLDFI